MTLRLLPLLLSGLAVSAAQPQAQTTRIETLSGRITGTSGQPVPYVNIGLTNRNRGTVSDHDGNFRLKVDSLTGGDTLRISCIGYAPRQFTGSTLTGSDFLTVELAETTQEIPEIVVYAGKERIRTFGHEFRKSGITASFHRGQEGGEVGVACRMKGRQGQLREARITLNGTTGIDTLHLRLNCYTLHDGEVGQNLCRKPAYLSVPAPKQRTTITVDLQPYDIWTTNDFLFSVENLTPMDDTAQWWFAAGLTGSCMSRYTSQSPWKHQFFGVGIQVDVVTRE